jgi:hypothetical protein
MTEKVLKLGDSKIAFTEENGILTPKNKEMLLKCFLYETKIAIEKKMTSTPTLHFKENLFSLEQLQDEIFQFKNIDSFLEVLCQTDADKLFSNNEKITTGVIHNRKIVKERKVAIIVPFFNVHSNQMLLENFDNFRRELTEDVFVIEAAFGDEPFLIKESEDFVRIRGTEENFMWQKERLLNIALSKLPPQYTDIAWLDADILFDNKNWVEEMQAALDKFCFVQLFQTVSWLNKDGSSDISFNTIVEQGKNLFSVGGDGEAQDNGFHPGFAWAARREVLEKTGWFDQHICGNGDSFIYYAIAGHLLAGNYLMIKNKLLGFNYCFLKFKRKISQAGAIGSLSNISGHVRHMYHGDFKERDYAGRQRFMIDAQFDPVEDLEIGDNGLYKWGNKNENTLVLSSRLLEYFKQRNKDE